LSETVWILGIHMTRFGKHPDKDSVDLAVEAATGAMRDAGVEIDDLGVLAAGNLLGGPISFGQLLQKQIGQTGIPVYNVANACATGATAVRTVMMSAWRSSPARGCWARRPRRPTATAAGSPRGASAP
jgi:acetyl-CoA acyltransferase